jgi:hypothetical protein
MESAKELAIASDPESWTPIAEKQLKALSAQISRRAKILLAKNPPKPEAPKPEAKKEKKQFKDRKPRVYHVGYQGGTNAQGRV